MPFDKNQQLAIEADGKNILVSASAGSGKTTVLIERLVQRLLSKTISLDRILVMTFSELAASEMKTRLQARLESLYDKSKDEKEKQYLRAQLALLPFAQISTIHSFCFSVVANYYYLLPLDPQALDHVLSESEVAQFQNEALDEVLREMQKEKPQDYGFLDRYCSPKALSDSSLRESVQNLAAFGANALRPEEWFEHIRQNFKPVKQYEDLSESLRELFRPYLHFTVLQLEEDGAQARAFLLDYYQKKDQLEYLNRADYYLKSLSALHSLIDQDQYHQYCEMLVWIGQEVSLWLPPIKDFKAYNTLLSKLKKNFKETITKLLPQEVLLKQFGIAHRPLNLLCDLALAYLKRYQQKKKDHLCLDFNDMEHFAFQILYDRQNRAARELQERYGEILVDEFQDTNRTQDAIIRLVARKNNIFRVGDVKQSIYGWRLAEPQIMQKLAAREDETHTNITLSHNYRCHQNIIDFTNEIFLKLMNITPLSGFDKDKDWALCGSDAQKTNGKPVEFHFLHPEIPDEDEEKPDAFDINEETAKYLCDTIWQMFDKENIRFGDIVILVRSKANKAKLREVLTHYGIPCQVQVPTGYYQSLALNAVLSLIKVILDPSDDISLTAVFHHFFHYSHGRLAKVKTQSETRFPQSLIQDKREFKEDLKAFRQAASILPLFDFVTSLCNYQDFYQHCDKQQQGNLDLLLEKTLEYQKQGGGLSGLLDYLEVEGESDSEESEVRGSFDDVVRVLTIHGSKGLQFPVVFYWGSFHHNNPEARSLLALHQDYGVACSIILSDTQRQYPFVKNAILFQNQLKGIEEEMRLLYVALTRAQNRLILVGAHRKVPDLKPLSFCDLFHKSPAQWLYQLFNELYPTQLKDVIIPMEESFMPHITHYEDERPPWALPHDETIISLKHESPSQFEPRVLGEIVFGGAKGTMYGTNLHKVFEDLPDTLWTNEMIEPLEIDATAKKALLYFGQSPLYQKALTMQIRKEMPFFLKEGHSLMQGYMDFIAYDDKEVILIDYKSDNVETGDTLIERYKPQQEAYAKALKVLFPGRDIHAYLFSVHLIEFIEVPLTA